MEATEKIGKMSTCPKGNVGSMILDMYGKSISFGYNGSPSGSKHCDEVGCLEIDGHCTNAVHAEINAILAGDTRRMAGGSMLLSSDLPCYKCAQAIVTVKILNLHTNITTLMGLMEDRERGLDILIHGGTILKIGVSK